MTTPDPTLAELAFRPGTPEEWSEPEYNYEVASRLCKALGVDIATKDMIEAAFAESDRQKELYDDWRHTRELRANERAYRHRMGIVVEGLVGALVAPGDPRDREVIKDKVFAALRPLDDRLRQAEWDGVIGS